MKTLGQQLGDAIRSCPCLVQACEAADREVNANAYKAAQRKTEEAAKRAKAARDRKPDRRRAGEDAGGEDALTAGGWDAEGVPPEFSLAGGAEQCCNTAMS